MNDNRCVELQQSVLLPLCYYLQSRQGLCSGISYIDSTSLSVCHNRRIQHHRSFAGLAARGKTSMEWFYGFKLHRVANDSGELLAFFLSAGNCDDRHPVRQLTQGLVGKLFGDNGFLSQKLFVQLAQQGL